MLEQWLTSDSTVLFSCLSAAQKSTCLHFVTMKSDALIDVSGGTRDWRPRFMLKKLPNRNVQCPMQCKVPSVVWQLASKVPSQGELGNKVCH